MRQIVVVLLLLYVYLQADTKSSLRYDLSKCRDDLASYETKLQVYNKQKNKSNSTKLNDLKIKIKNLKQNLSTQKATYKNKLLTKDKIISRLNNKLKEKDKIISRLNNKLNKKDKISITKEKNQLLPFAKLVRGKRSYSLIKRKPNITKDNLQNLLWQREDDGKKRTFSEAQKYCKNLKLDGLKGWRLPTIKELYYLADRSKYRPAIDTSYFKNTKNYWYWSSSGYVDDSSNAWIVDFKYGYDDFYAKSGTYLVRCTRQ